IGRTLSRGQMAEREGFEPSRRFPAYTLSRRAPSTTRPPLRGALLSVRRGAKARGGDKKSAFRSARENEAHAPVLPALVLDPADGHAADLAGARDVCSAAGLQVDHVRGLADPDETNPALPSGRRYRHGLDQAGARKSGGEGTAAGPRCV